MSQKMTRVKCDECEYEFILEAMVRLPLWRLKTITRNKLSNIYHENHGNRIGGN
jgi:hypothetical protein